MLFKIMKSEKLILRVIQEKKEVYYPLFTITISYLFYWICILFISLANSQIILPFLLLSVAVLIFVYSFDMNNALKKKFESVSKKLVFFLIFVSIIISLIAIVRLIFLTLFDIYYIIPISIHILASVLIYVILRREVKKYYFKKYNHIIE